jgi:hypothetical protein
MRMLHEDNARVNSISFLVRHGLGYCCEWSFFQFYKDCELIAIRLGVSSRAVRKHKAAVLAGEIRCTNCKGCLKKLIPEKFSPGLPSR